MADLWETLTIGLVCSLVFIGLSYFFWRRYDQPTPLMIERAEEKQRLKDEQQTWREIEAKVRAEMAEAEEKAWIDRQRAEKAARAKAPEPTEMSGAWASLGVDAPAKGATSQEGENGVEFQPDTTDLNAEHRAQVGLGAVPLEANDDDVLDVAELVQVRQDAGRQALPDAPDWELVEKLAELASKDNIDVPNVPEAPDLDALTPADTLSVGTSDETLLVELEQTSDAVEAVESGGNAEDSPANAAGEEVPSPPSEEPVNPDSPEVVPSPTEESWGEDDGSDPWSGTAW